MTVLLLLLLLGFFVCWFSFFLVWVFCAFFFFWFCFCFVLGWVWLWVCFVFLCFVFVVKESACKEGVGQNSAMTHKGTTLTHVWRRWDGEGEGARECACQIKEGERNVHRVVFPRACECMRMCV